MFPNWNWALFAVSTSFHGAAILSTLFRLWYRWHTARMWWDDGWASIALLADIACLIAVVLEQPIPDDDVPQYFTVANWIFSLAYPTLMWTARISILTSIVRVLRPEDLRKHIVVAIGVIFGLTGLAMLAMRLRLCITCACLMTRGTLIAQTAADCVTDVLLCAIPIWFLHGLRLSRKRKVLISSAFSATAVIIIVTIIELVILFGSADMTSGSIVFEHVKVACSMIVCNLLVIVAFVYRILHKGDAGIGAMPETSTIEFTTVDLTYWGESSQAMSRRWAPSSRMTESSSIGPLPGGRSKMPITVVAPRTDVERVDEWR